jgi:hypothetical protein
VILFFKKGRSPFSLISDRFEDFMITFITYPFLHRCTHCTSRAFYRDETNAEPLCGRCLRRDKPIKGSV